MLIPNKKVLALPAKQFELAVKAKEIQHLRRNGKVFIKYNSINYALLRKELGSMLPPPMAKYYDWPGGVTPFAVQKVTSLFLSVTQRGYVLNSMGCVDAETEFLSPEGWKRISEWNGEEVAQYVPETGSIQFVAPKRYIKLPCDRMLHIKTKYGVDQMLSEEHRVLLQSKHNPDKFEVVTAKELYDRHEAWVAGKRLARSLNKIGYSQASIPVTFSAGGRGLPLSDAQLRLQVAVVADGHFVNKTPYCTVRLKKSRKIERLRKLIENAGIDAYIREPTAPTARGFWLFSFNAPRREKEFTSWWWRASEHQLKVIADEVWRWGGSEGKRGSVRFFTRSKLSADFIQYAFIASGRTAQVLAQVRKNGAVGYVVYARSTPGPAVLASMDSYGNRRRVMEWVSSPDGYKYCFEVPSSFLVLRRNGCVFVTGNSGKTLASLWAYDYLRKEGTAKRMLVLAPLSTLERVWADEIFFRLPHLTYRVLTGSAERRLRLLEDPADIYILNHDGLRVKVVLERLQKMVGDGEITHVLVDEGAAFRNQQTIRWKALRSLTPVVDHLWVWWLTATPMPNSPVDVWAQVRIVTPWRITPSKIRWRDLTMRQVGPFRWIPKRDAIDRCYAVMRPSVRFALEDCVDLPPHVMEHREVPMTREQNKAFDQMMKRLYAELKSGAEITAANEAVKAGKLLQILCGVVYDENGNPSIVNAKPRVQELLEVIEQADRKVIVFAPYIPVIKLLGKVVKDSFIVYGDIPMKERAEIFHRFQKTNEGKVLIAHPATMAHGLTLTAANIIIWYGAIYSNEIYEQAIARIRRPGQKYPTVIVHISSHKWETDIYRRLERKQKLQGMFLKLFQRG